MRAVVAKAFSVLLDAGGRRLSFAAGEQEIPDEIAGHWYVRLHLAEPTEPAELADEASPSATPAPVDVDDKAALKAEAEALGIAVDGRWGVERIKTAIAEAKGA